MRDPLQEADWEDANRFTVEGRPWFDPAAPWGRLPTRAKETVRSAVWDLSRHSAGISIRLIAEPGPLRLRWTLTSTALAMPHMPATGVSGLDVYVKDNRSGWRFVRNATPTGPTNMATVSVEGPSAREIMVYLPLYNGVARLEMAGAARGALRPAPSRRPGQDKPVVIYGTSIVQGGCASRPGMAWPAILGRRVDRPIVNLGFSGNGKLDPEMGPLLAEIDAAAFVVDCLHNCGGMPLPELAQRVSSIATAIRERSHAPILFVGSSPIDSGKPVDARSRLQEETVGRLSRDGVANLHSIPGTRLNGADGDATVDGVHPTDLGMLRHAETLEPAVRRLLRHA